MAQHWSPNDQSKPQALRLLLIRRLELLPIKRTERRKKWQRGAEYRIKPVMLSDKSN
jgi:hypothetical protein